MSRKSLERSIAPPSEREIIDGVGRAMTHGRYMHANGMLSATELEQLHKAAIAERINHLDGDEFTQAMASGHLDKLREAAGYDDEEASEDGEARRASIMSKVFVNMLASAAQAGAIDPKDALQAIAEHTELPEDHGNDPQGAIDTLHEHSGTPDTPMREPGQNGMSDDELQAALAGALGDPNARGVERETIVDMPDAHSRRRKG
jgi:hypothetical protein